MIDVIDSGGFFVVRTNLLIKNFFIDDNLFMYFFYDKLINKSGHYQNRSVLLKNDNLASRFQQDINVFGKGLQILSHPIIRSKLKRNELFKTAQKFTNDWFLFNTSGFYFMIRVSQN